MSQHEPQWDRTHTLLGYERLRKLAPGAAAREPGVDGLGARVVPNRELYETDRVPGPGRRVIKLFSWGAGLAGEVVRDFTRDAMTVADLRHPHVVQVAESGALPDGTPFVVMERLPGRTLEEALIEAGPLPPAELVPILRGVASALSAAHAAGVAHGELGTDNVFLAEVPGYARGFPKLLDFGVARLSAAARVPGRACHERPPDAPSDRLALAALAHRLLTSGRVVDAASALALDQVISQAAGPPDQRFDSMASLLDALEAALMATGPAAAPPPEPAEPASLTQQFFTEGEKQEAAHAEAAAGVPDPDPDPDTRTLDRVPRSRAPFVATASLVLLCAALMAWTVVSLTATRGATAPSSSPERPPSTAVAASTPLVPPHASDTAPSGRPILRHAHLASAAPQRSRPRTEPPAVAAITGVLRPSSPEAVPTASPAVAPAPSPEPTPAPAPVPEPQPQPPTTAAPAAPVDEDFTQPWEQTEGEPSEASEPAAPPSPEPATGAAESITGR